jgi:hypothetical protein
MTNSIVDELVNTWVGVTDVIDRSSLSTINEAPEVAQGKLSEPTRVTKTDDALPMRGLRQTANVSDNKVTSD